MLIVEDYRDLRELMAEVLMMEGYAVVTAADGREGLTFLAEMRLPCLVILDLNMPVIVGAEGVADVPRGSVGFSFSASSPASRALPRSVRCPTDKVRGISEWEGAMATQATTRGRAPRIWRRGQ